eukprot:428071-Pyramimonas_sp.AAC.2
MGVSSLSTRRADPSVYCPVARSSAVGTRRVHCRARLICSSGAASCRVLGSGLGTSTSCIARMRHSLENSNVCPESSAMIAHARRYSLRLDTRRSIMRERYTFPRRMNAPVVRMFSVSFSATSPNVSIPGIRTSEAAAGSSSFKR